MVCRAVPDYHFSCSTLPGWSFIEDGKKIKKDFEFKDFKQAWEFMNRIAVHADKKDHHPEWFNVYNKVSITLTTHTEGGVTAKDINLAYYAEKSKHQLKAIDSLIIKRLAPLPIPK